MSFLYSLRFDSSVAPLIFADQFIKFSTLLSSSLVYGFGEHQQPLLINVTSEWKRLTFYNRDFPPIQYINLYGSLYLLFPSNDVSHNSL